MMLELNNAAVLGVITNWAARKLGGGPERQAGSA
jgi:hypothetical protein